MCASWHHHLSLSWNTEQIVCYPSCSAQLRGTQTSRGHQCSVLQGLHELRGEHRTSRSDSRRENTSTVEKYTMSNATPIRPHMGSRWQISLYQLSLVNFQIVFLITVIRVPVHGSVNDNVQNLGWRDGIRIGVCVCVSVCACTYNVVFIWKMFLERHKAHLCI